jgi:hypothetical protein
LNLISSVVPKASLLIILSASSPVQALTGEELYRYCQQEACGGYFVGAFDAVRVADAIVGPKKVGSKKEGEGPLHFCPPENVSDEEVVDRALNYLERHAESRHLQAANLSLRAWVEAWPCSR